ncbi:GAF and ANTAR domain-containing protein [Rhodococcoides kyotonense]|nr:GAF and ANTAR domain-containing protein [Rhodococcus kyotonensis]
MHTSSSSNPVTADTVIAEVTAGATRFVPGVDHAGVSLIHQHGKKRSFEAVAPTGDIPEYIDHLQEKLGIGPCLDAIRDKATLRVADYTVEARWPELTEAILGSTAVRSSLSIFLYTDQQSIGALNLYSETTDSFDEDIIEQAEALAAHAAVGISGARRDEQFRSALASRDIIGQAKGIVMERFAIDALQAFRLLSKLSQDQNIPVLQLAQQVIDSEHP